MNEYLKNIWYAAAYCDELGEKPLARTLMGVNVALFRDKHGKAGMIVDRCPHRFAPLSAGRIVDDSIECPYHGLRFDVAGRCVHNPHSKTKGPLPAANIQAWPLMERYGVLWFWPGEPEKADPDLLATVDFLEQPDKYALVHGLVHVRGHYELIVDNLLDLSHASYLHPQFSGTRYSIDELLAATKYRMERRERSIVNHRMRSGLGPPAASCELFGMDPDIPVHTDSTMTWYPPAMLSFAAGSWEMDKEPETGVHIPQLHFVTPETELTSHYFFINGRNRRRDEPEVDQIMLDFFDLAFRQQDEPMIEMVQRNMGDVTDINELRPVLLATDAASVTARRMLAAMIAAERGDTPAQAADEPAFIA